MAPSLQFASPGNKENNPRFFNCTQLEKVIHKLTFFSISGSLEVTLLNPEWSLSPTLKNLIEKLEYTIKKKPGLGNHYAVILSNISYSISKQT